MRIVIEHLRTRTIPHDLMELMEDVPVYEGCMIVQIHDHKSTAPSQDQTRQDPTVGKTTPFSVHNYNTFLTPSPYVPYPKQNAIPSRGNTIGDGEQNDSKPRSTEQKDKENMPAPALPGDASRHKLATIPRKPKVSTIVLHPTSLSEHFSVATKTTDFIGSSGGRRDSRLDIPGSATVPPTPSLAIPPTPIGNNGPPPKRLKKSQADAVSSQVYEAESIISSNTGTRLALFPVKSAMECVQLLDDLAPPLLLEKPPSPKSRKRTVAEMAADEALAADQERYMLLLDERLSSSATGAPGANPNDGNGQAGGASFEPRFERFKLLANIKNQHEEKAQKDRLAAEAREREVQLQKERKKKQDEAEALQKSSENQQRQAAQQQAARAAEMQRRQLAAQAQAHAQSMQGVQNMPGQGQGQHAHPQANGMMPNGVQGQPQRFHQQQSQAQVSSPIPRNGTPQNHSSPMNNNMGNVPMQHSNSNMGGSPARPGSVVQQNQTPMGAQAMAQQRSQNSHAGTPRMPSATPNLQNTPLMNRQVSQTPRMNQGSPLPGQNQQPAQMIMLPNGQQITALQHQQMLQAQLNRNRMVQAQASAMAQQNPQMMNATNNPAMQQQIQMLQQQRAMAAMGANPNYNPQMAAAMAARQAQGGAGNMMNGNFGNQSMPSQVRMDPSQIQAMQQMQQQANIQRAAQAQAHQQAQTQQAQAQQMFAAQVMRLSSAIYQDKVQACAQQYPGGIPEDVDRQLKVHCQQQATMQLRQRRQQMAQQAQQQQQMMAQQGMGGMNGMQNGMGM